MIDEKNPQPRENQNSTQTVINAPNNQQTDQKKKDEDAPLQPYRSRIQVCGAVQ
jgi:hypothetical protein